MDVGLDSNDRYSFGIEPDKVAEALRKLSEDIKNKLSLPSKYELTFSHTTEGYLETKVSVTYVAPREK